MGVSLVNPYFYATTGRKMCLESCLTFELAPLQKVMLRDSLNAPTAGYHVEQVELVFTPGVWRERVRKAWEKTVAETEVLRIAFQMDGTAAQGFEVARGLVSLSLEKYRPASWSSWLAADRCRPLLRPHHVPWRACYWPDDGRFLWTFHHALLDGRSITAILKQFKARVVGGVGESLTLSKWPAPSSEAVELARQMFQEDFPRSLGLEFEFQATREGPARQVMGVEMLGQWERMAQAFEVSAASLLVWAWGQALVEFYGRETVVIEQLRAGAPQPGRAGFTMLTLPVAVSRLSQGGLEDSVKQFRKKLFDLRVIEGVAEADVPWDNFPDVDRRDSSVIMVEHATLQSQIRGPEIDCVSLRESKGESLMAIAYMRPDFCLEVEGPARHELLAAWIKQLSRMLSGCAAHSPFV